MPFSLSLSLAIMDVCTAWVESLPAGDDRLPWSLKLTAAIMRTLEHIEDRMETVH